MAETSIAVVINDVPLVSAASFNATVPAIPNGISKGFLCFRPGEPTYSVLNNLGQVIFATRQKPFIEKMGRRWHIAW